MVHKTYIYFKALQLWCWKAPSSSPSLTSSCICFSFARSTPYAALEDYSINSQLVHLLPIAILNLIMAKTSNGGWVTTIEGPNAVKCFCSNTVLLYKFHLTDCWNMRDQIMQGRSSKRPWSNCVLCIPFILSRSPNECWLHTCSACIITTLRLGLRAPLVARKKLVSGQCLAKMTICPDEFLVCKSFWLDRFPVNGMEWFYSSCTFYVHFFFRRNYIFAC